MHENTRSEAAVRFDPGAPAAHHTSATVPSILLTLEALLVLAIVDVTLRVRGYRTVRRWLVRKNAAPHQTGATADVQARVLAAIDRAAMLYPSRAMCLQRSAVATWLLRRRHIPAQMVIGCRHTPFYAHAWVEVDGVVVNDRPLVREWYPEMERL
jgi:hypothetical protein